MYCVCMNSLVTRTRFPGCWVEVAVVAREMAVSGGLTVVSMLEDWRKLIKEFTPGRK